MFALQVALMKGQGGVFTSLFHYARMWEEVGVRSACLYSGPGVERLRQGGVSVVDAPPSLTTPFFPISPDLGRLRREIRAIGGGDPDCAMVHSDLALRAVRRMFPHCVLMTRCHSDKTKHKRDADIVVTLNPDQHERVSRALAGSRARVRMFGHPFIMTPPPTSVAAPGPLRINLVARFVPAKDPMTFVRAVNLLERPLPAIRVIGAGDMEQDLREGLRTGGVEVEFAGWRAEPLADFTANDILVLPSAWEGLPWLLLEAQARGIPSIASDIPGNRLALGGGDHGDLFPVGDERALAARLIDAIANLEPLRAKAERGRNALPSRYGPRAFWDNLENAMREVRTDKR